MGKRIAIASTVVVGIVAGAFFGGLALSDPTTSTEYGALAEELGDRGADLEAAEERLEVVDADLSRTQQAAADLQAQLDALTSKPRDGGGAQGEPAVSGDAALAPRNLKIAIRTRSKQCFGSAGCSVTIQVEPSYVGKQDVSSGSWEITYEIRGGEDGALIETMTLENGTFSFPAEQNLSTTSSGVSLEAVVTEVYSLN